MLKEALFWYCLNAAILFCVLYVAGRIHLRKEGLGNGVKLGFLNTFLLSAFWPITTFCIGCGVLYALFNGWKRL